MAPSHGGGLLRLEATNGIEDLFSGSRGRTVRPLLGQHGGSTWADLAAQGGRRDNRTFLRRGDPRAGFEEPNLKKEKHLLVLRRGKRLPQRFAKPQVKGGAAPGCGDW